MATLKDVAKEAGLTVGTVSRVLNNRGYISDKARAKVDAAKIPEFVDLYQGKMKFIADKKLTLFIYTLKLNSRQKESPVEVVEQVLYDCKMLTGKSGEKKNL